MCDGGYKEIEEAVTTLTRFVDRYSAAMVGVLDAAQQRFKKAAPLAISVHDKSKSNKTAPLAVSLSAKTKSTKTTYGFRDCVRQRANV